MKKILLTLLAVGLLACSDDDGGTPPNPNLEVVVGTWTLTELRISPAQDIDEDGTTTTNVLDELSCVQGTLTLRSDNTWSFGGTDVVITTITGGLFKFFCADQPRNAGGNWDLQGNTLRLADGSGNLTLFAIDATAVTLTNTIGDTLPGLQAEVYAKSDGF